MHKPYAEYLPVAKPYHCGIYKITDQVNDYFYIGSSKEIENRWTRHVIELNKNIQGNPKFQAIWNKRDPEIDWEFEILEECKEHELLEREQFYIDLLKPEININKIATKPPSCKGKKHSKEHSAKIGANTKKNWENPEYRANMIQSAKNQWKNPEFREKMKLVSRRKSKIKENNNV